MDPELKQKNEAARKLQLAYRSRVARAALRKLVRANYVKVYDKFNDCYVYKNKNTKEIFPKKPTFLGSEDLPNPRIYVAPADYDPRDEHDEDGYALLVTVNGFTSGKLVDIPVDPINNDHILLEENLIHDYVCKFRPENVICLKNPTCQSFQEALHQLRRICKTKAFLTIYICTHVLTVFKGEKDNKKETGYLCMNDTVWARPALITKTAISLTDFAALLNKISCKRKTVLLNYCHLPDPRHSIFASKYLYPPPDFATRLADEAHCVVIANCSNGTSFVEVIRHTPINSRHPISALKERCGHVAQSGALSHLYADLMHSAAGSAVAATTATSRISPAAILKHRKKKKKKWFGLCGRKTAHSHLEEMEELQKQLTMQSQSGKGSLDRQASAINVAASGKTMNVGTMKLLVPSQSISSVDSEGSPSVVPSDDGIFVEFDDQYDWFMSEWKVEPDQPIVVTPAPVVPEATWKKNEETNFEIKVELPAEEELRKHTQRHLLWRIRHAIAQPVNASRRRYRLYKKFRRRSPFQTSVIVNSKLNHEKQTMFARAVLEAMRGGACEPSNPIVTVDMMFTTIYQGMKKNCVEIEAEMEAAEKLAKEEAEAERLLEEQKRAEEEAEEQAKQDAVAGIIRSPSKSKIVAAAPAGKKELQNAEKAKTVDDDERKDHSKEHKHHHKHHHDQLERKTIERPHQVPLMIAPMGNFHLVNNPVFCRCGPPAPPERPYVVRVGRNDVQLEWYNPDFDGIPAFKYKVYMLNMSRNFNKWCEVPYPGDILSNRFLVRNLPSGVPCQFKVSGFNNGGWGSLSEETLVVIPGEEWNPVSTEVRWRRLTKGGTLTIVDKLKSCPVNRYEHVIGFHRLVTFAQRDGGFPKGTLSKKIALLVLHSLQQFPEDPEIASVAFPLLGWSLKGWTQRSNVSRLLQQHNITELCVHYQKEFRSNSHIISGIAFARAFIEPAETLPYPPEIIVPVFKERRKRGSESDDEDSSDEEEESKTLE